MIPKETIDEIFDKCVIEDVIGSYLADLKKKGANYWACCPFHNEKTPSFSVSPAKGIYKCFGCGKGGNSVNFVMEIGGLTYPEALKELADKYNIKVEEKELTPDQIKKENEKSSVLLISKYANEFFQKKLWGSKEGKLIGLTYFKSRGFSESMIKKFELGYSPKEKNILSKQAIKDSYQKEFLEKSGLAFSSNQNLIDKFRDRVIFPIHNYAGKVVGFGGRSLNKDRKAKYINSPENPIYHKSHILYGLFFSKNSISKKDSCYIVEGYTDVISMHQAGIENVVAASGTALSSIQINLIKRLTKNVIILFDGDEAGLEAAFRNVDFILKEGMNVEIVTFPKGEDPDSYARKLNEIEFNNFISENVKDFIRYKTELLQKKSGDSPSKRVEAIRNIAKSISLMPDRLSRIEYSKLSSSLLNISESDLLKEILKFRNKKTSITKNIAHEKEEDIKIESKKSSETILLEECEKEILRLLLNYGERSLMFESHQEKVSLYIMEELTSDNITFSNHLYKEMMEEYSTLSLEKKVNIKHFLNHERTEIQQLAINLITKKHEISKKWEDLHHIFIEDETKNLERTIEKSILCLKQAYIKSEIQKIHLQLDDNIDSIKIVENLKKHTKALVAINKLLGRNFN